MFRQLKKLLEMRQTLFLTHCLQNRPALTQSTYFAPQIVRSYCCSFQQVWHLHRPVTRSRCMHPADVRTKQPFVSVHGEETKTASTQTDALEGSSSDDIVTFIKDDGDLQRFLAHVKNLLTAPESSKLKISTEDAEAKLEEFVSRLIDMRAGPRNIFAFLQSNPKILNSKWDVLMSNLQFLDELYLLGNHALLVLDHNPILWSASLKQLQERIRRLRKLGLTEGSLQRVITAWPTILTLRKSRLNGSVEMLRRCQFTSSHITTIIVSSPRVLDSDPADIEHRFQYVYFTMGLKKQDDMVRANLFRYPLEHIRQRHLVLERLGLYEMPDKKGHTRTDNPKLGRIIDCTDARFAERCAGISLEEFQVFGRTLRSYEEAAEEVEDESEDDDIEEDFADYDHTKER